MTTLRVRPAADRDTELAADFYAREADIDVARVLHGARDLRRLFKEETPDP